MHAKCPAYYFCGESRIVVSVLRGQGSLGWFGFYLRCMSDLSSTFTPSMEPVKIR